MPKRGGEADGNIVRWDGFEGFTALEHGKPAGHGTEPRGPRRSALINDHH